MKQNTVRLNFEFPEEHYPYLKMVCAKKKMSIKDFASNLIIREIEEYEDDLLLQEAHKRLEEADGDTAIPFEEAIKLAGWSDEKV